MVFCVEPGAWEAVFAVPSAVVDRYIKFAGKAQLRVLLYLLRHPGTEIEEQALSDALALHPDEVSQALGFWKEEGLLYPKGAVPAPPGPSAAEPLPTKTSPNAEPAATPEAPPAPRKPKIVTRTPINDPAVVAARINESPELRALMEETEVILGKNLRTWEADVLINLHDADGMPVDVIVMVVQYAVARGRATIRYIETTARNWIDEGVDTFEMAEQKIRRLTSAGNAWKKVSALLHIDTRKPSAKEEELVLIWKDEWKMPDPLILEAYDRCVNATGKMSFAYIHRILLRWHEEGFMTLKQVEAGEAKPDVKKSTQGKKGKPSPSYDLEAFEQLIMNGDLTLEK